MAEGTIYERLRDKQAKENMRPYIGHVVATARDLGMNPDFAIATINAESRGDTSAVGDKGQSVGMWQIKSQYAKDWGMTPAQRTDPIASTNGVMPKLKGLLDAAGGDFALARMMYMRGPRSAPVRALQRGEKPEDVLAKDPVALAQYKLFRRLGGESVAPKVTPGPQVVPVPTGPTQGLPSLPPMAAAPQPTAVPALGLAEALPVGYYSEPTQSPPPPVQPTGLAALGINPLQPEAPIAWPPLLTA